MPSIKTGAAGRSIFPAASTIALCLLLAACGGSSKKSSTSASGTTTGSKSTTKTTPAHRTLPTLAEGVLTAGGKTPAPTLSAKAGDAVTFRTQLPGVPKKKVNVELTLPLGPAAKLTVTAKVNGKTATASVTGAGGKKVTLQQLHYECLFPPLRTVCPLHNVSTSPTQDRVQLTYAGGSLLSFGAKVGPAPVPTRNVKVSGTVVPAYKLTLKVRQTPKVGTGQGAPSPLGPTVSVKPGSVLTMLALAGGLGGAPQKMTLTLPQGPAKTITLSASVPGGKTATATVTSATGKPIELIVPRYQCFFPPTPTFCPASSVQAGNHKYLVTFPVTPSSQPVVVQATIQ